MTKTGGTGFIGCHLCEALLARGHHACFVSTIMSREVWTMWPLMIEYQRLPQDDPLQRCPDITKAREILGWEPLIDLETSLLQTIDYFQSIL